MVGPFPSKGIHGWEVPVLSILTQRRASAADAPDRVGLCSSQAWGCAPAQDGAGLRIQKDRRVPPSQPGNT